MKASTQFFTTLALSQLLAPLAAAQESNIDNSEQFIANILQKANHSNLIISKDTAYRVEPRYNSTTNVDSYTISPNGKSVVLFSSNKIGLGTSYDGLPSTDRVSVHFSNNSGVDSKVAWSKTYSSSTNSSAMQDYLEHGCWLDDSTYSFLRNPSPQAWTEPVQKQEKELVVLDTASGRMNSFKIPADWKISFIPSIKKAVAISHNGDTSKIQIFDKSGFGPVINGPKDASALGVDEQKTLYIQGLGNKGSTYHILSAAGTSEVESLPDIVTESAVAPINKQNDLEILPAKNSKLLIQTSSPDNEATRWGFDKFTLNGTEGGFLNQVRIEGRATIPVWNYDPETKTFSVNLLFVGPTEKVKSAIKFDIQNAQREALALRIQDYLGNFFEAHQKMPSTEEFYRRFKKEDGLTYSPTSTEDNTYARYFEWHISTGMIWRKVG